MELLRTITKLARSVTAPAVDPFTVGEVINGHYQIRGILGRGGMSCVYEADDLTLRRRVAIKVDDRRDGAALLREAQALAAVRHPGLPAVHELGAHRGWPYLVLERLVGQTLEQRLDALDGDARFSIVEAVRVLAGVADVLGSVHAAGLVHRDVKPANVMQCRAERVVLLDFGIMLPEIGAGDAVSCGTPAYLAPEVAAGTIQPGSAHLIDVYAFGVTAFEMLTGEPPFVASQVDALMLAHACTPPPDLRLLRPDAPEALVSMIEACLAKSPFDRPASIELVSWELQAIQRRWTRLAKGSSPNLIAPR